MARPLRIEFPGAIYHAMSRGNARQVIFRDDDDRRQLLDDLEDSVVRCGWELFAFVFMPNHFHLFLRTPRPNLAKGMQRLLSSYANRFARRHRRPGHLFQGRYKGELIEDESYFWTVSRYIHLNPVRGKYQLVSHPSEFVWSSYPGYLDKRKRLSWVAYDTVLAAWQGERGGRDPAAAYRRYVQQGVEVPPRSPFEQAQHGWLLGSQGFVDRIRRELKAPRFADEVPRVRTLDSVEWGVVFTAVSRYFNVDPSLFARRGNRHIARAAAAWLSRRLTTATLRELAAPLGLSRPDCVSNLTRRMEHYLQQHPKVKKDLAKLEVRLAKKTKNKV